MGKSNKFDYSNRGSTGKRLGVIIGGALQKESEKVKKDAERHAQKARKQSSDSSGGSDPPITTHILDLKAPGKELGDEGIFALADGLELALNNGTMTASLALEDLNLAKNDITVAALARLAPIIELARFDLKTLNVCDNALRVESDQDAAHWETFLHSFLNCQKLRRLDLDGNSLGARAVEVLARVHFNEPVINPTAFEGDTSVLSLISETSDHKGSGGADDTSGASDGQNGRDMHMVHGQVIKRRSGLRAIPYITLTNIDLTDAGALWLSFILEDHYYPQQLIDGLNATSAESSIKAYQQDTSSEGIDWSKDRGLTKDGIFLLEKTEALRRQMFHDADDNIVSSAALSDVDAAADDGVQARKSADGKHHRSVISGRRLSIRSIRTADGGEHEATEIESARRKIQRAIIEHNGASSVELWQAGLKVFISSRMIYNAIPAVIHQRIRDNHQAIAVIAAACVSPYTNGKDTMTGDHGDNNHTTESKGKTSIASVGKPSYASALSLPATQPSEASPNIMADPTNFPPGPATSEVFNRPKGFYSDAESLADQLNNLATEVPSEAYTRRALQYQQKRATSQLHQSPAQTKQTSPTFPVNLIERIITHLDPDLEMGVLGSAQLVKAIERGQDRASLTTEREWLRMGRSAQIWMLLDSLRCLAYEDE